MITEMFDLDVQTVEIECPLCGFYSYVTMKQARLRDVVICRGCKANICLDDSMNECRKGIRRARQSMAELERETENLNRALRF